MRRQIENTYCIDSYTPNHLRNSSSVADACVEMCQEALKPSGFINKITKLINRKLTSWLSSFEIPGAEDMSNFK